MKKEIEIIMIPVQLAAVIGGLSFNIVNKTTL